jgi:hypothetical protein
MTGVVNLPKGGLDVVPATLIVESALDNTGDKRAPATRANPAIELCYQVIIQCYVQSHVFSITHNLGQVITPAKCHMIFCF